MAVLRIVRLLLFALVLSVPQAIATYGQDDFVDSMFQQGELKPPDRTTLRKAKELGTGAHSSIEPGHDLFVSSKKNLAKASKKAGQEEGCNDEEHKRKALKLGNRHNVLPVAKSLMAGQCYLEKRF